MNNREILGKRHFHVSFFDKVYMTWLYLVFMYILPFTLLAIFNILIYMEIRKATKKRTRLTRLIFSSISI